MARYERNGKSLRQLVLDLCGNDQKAKDAAGYSIAHMYLGLEMDAEGRERMDTEESSGFPDKLQEILLAPDFPGVEIIRQLIHERTRERVRPSPMAFRTTLRGGRDVSSDIELAIDFLCDSLGSAAIGVLPELMSMAEADPASLSGAFASACIAGIGAQAVEATEVMFHAQSVLGDRHGDYVSAAENFSAPVRAIAAFSDVDAAILPRLIERAARGTECERNGAIATVTAMGSRAADALPTLFDMLDRPDCVYRVTSAIAAIAEAGDQLAIDALRRGLARASDDDQSGFVDAMCELGVSDAEIAESLERRAGAHNVPAVAADNASAPDEALIESGIQAIQEKLRPIVPALISGERGDRIQAADDFLSLLDDCMPLWSLAAGANRNFRDEALARLLAEPDFPTEDVLDASIDRYLAATDDYNARHAKSKSIGWITSHESVRTGHAHRAIVAHCGARGVAILPRLAQLLRREDCDRCMMEMAANAMLSIGEPARTITDALLDNFLAGANRGYPEPGLDFIERHGLDEAQLTRVIAMAEQGAIESRVAAISVLRTLGTRAVSAEASLRRHAVEGPTWVRAAAIIALVDVGADRRALEPLLLNGMEDTDDDIRHAATSAAAHVENALEALIDQLISLTNDTAWYVRGQAIQTLAKLRRRVNIVVQAAVRLLDDNEEGHDWTARDSALDAIAELGPAAAAAVPRLVELLREDTDAVQSVAGALGAIGAAAAPALASLRIALANHSDDDETIEQAIRLIERGG
ncbi:MAG TPA: hypothetical protein P5081_09535 [Phycisphaerae bacterium]|nr:hypothetical protein [Phycisphaerae bacterium]HRW53117.1 hypothetical protein [Phycisphaerae bacterium]